MHAMHATHLSGLQRVNMCMQGEAVAGKRFSVVAEYALRVLGLDYIADTFVGGPMLRGISGGQKKRLTTGEMLVGCDVQEKKQILVAR